MSQNPEHEQTLNVYMAKLLSSGGLAAKPEVARNIPDGGRARVDIEVRIGPACIAIEAEQGQSTEKRRSAIADADKRIDQGLADCALAVCYPESSSELNLPGAEFLWCVRDEAGSEPQWRSGDLERLISVIRLMPAQLGNPDFAAAALSASLDAAVERLTDQQKQGLARGMNLPAGKRGRRGTNIWDRPAKRALLVVSTAVMFHARLDEHTAEIKPSQDSRYAGSVPFEGAWPPKQAHLCEQSDDPVNEFRDAWNLFLAADYTPIFRTARAALNACTPNPAFSEAVRITARAALVVVQNIAGMRHDLLGRVFHTVLDSARYDGSFYTTTAAATLLAALAIDEDMCDWRDLSAVSSLQITDPACGTGTLLMAVAERIRDLHLRERGGEPDDVARALIEDVLTGFDINLTATHLAATTLGLLSPTTQFSQMKVGQTFLGVDDEDSKAYLGSLEFLDAQPKLMPWPNGNGNGRPKQVDSNEEIATVAPSDLVIMNPPFTRDSLRHDQFSAEEEQRIKEREKEIFARTPVHLSNNGGAFMYLADFLCKPDAGAVAFVLPLVGATNYSTIGMRRYLAREFQIDTVVTSHDPQRIFFSENTTIGEMLVVCRRPQRRERVPTRVINLAINPANPTDAVALYDSIQEGTLSERGWGTTQYWPASRIEDGDWGAVQFLSPHLCESYEALKAGELFPVQELASVASIGPAGQAVRESFSRSMMPSQESMRALWHHDSTIRTSLAATTDTQLIAKSNAKGDPEKLWAKRGRLLLPTHMSLTSIRMLSVRLNRPALGSLWVPCKPHVDGIEDEDVEKALCVYLNSSVGILAVLGNRTNKSPRYPTLAIHDMRNIPVPAFANRPGAMRELASVFDGLESETFQPLHSMDQCETRRSLDDAVADHLSIDHELVSTLREILSEEPSITGRRYSG